MTSYKTQQENFWAGEFGDEYINRNSKIDCLPGRTALFAQILTKINEIDKVIEFGANIGNNLIALKSLLPQAELSAIEINPKAAEVLRGLKDIKVYSQSILDFKPDYYRDLSFTVGVLIHINPEMLPYVYDSLFNSSKRYICIVEYYNPTPVEIPYRGHSGKLFKRDFAGEMLDKYPKLRLIDYGFFYHRDIYHLDDPTWFLLEKR